MSSRSALELLSAMITPAVLISACGTLILSTSTRLARIFDRVRALSQVLEGLFEDEETRFADLRRSQVGRQLELQTQRGQLLQRALTSFYVALGAFVATTVAIGIVSLLPHVSWIPAALGILGTIILLFGCVVLIRETRIAGQSVDLEVEFVRRLQELYGAADGARAEPRLGSG